MYQNNNVKHRYSQQWVFLTRRLQHWLKSGDFTRFSKYKQQFLQNRLQRLYGQMLRYQTAKQLRKALGAAALLLGLGSMPGIQAQAEFADPQINPFGLQSELGLSFHTLADIDADGDLDIISVLYEDGDYANEQSVVFRENTGTPTSPTFSTPTQDVLIVDLPIINDQYINPELADLDGDGDLDLIVGTYNDYEGTPSSISYFENIGDPQNPSFGVPSINPFGLNFAGSQLVTPTAADLDGDGDLDIVSLFYQYDYENNIYEYGIVYVENIGSPMAPAFATAQREAFNLPSDPDRILFMEFGDIDNDGDLDLLAGSVYDYNYGYEIPFRFFENIGDAQNPNFSTEVVNPFDLVSGSSIFLWPMLGDLDNDGDLDLLHGANYNEETYENSFVYQENLLLMVDVEDQALTEGGFTTFPTVSKGRYQVKVTDIATSGSPFKLRVFNALGELVQDMDFVFTPSASFEIDLTNQSAGLYHLELTQGLQRWVQPIIKQ